MQRIADGIELEDGPIHADAVSYATDTDRIRSESKFTPDETVSSAVFSKL